MTPDSPEQSGLENSRKKFAEYLEEVVGYAEEALNELNRGNYPENEVEAISDLADASGDRMWGIRPPYDAGYLPEDVQESVESLTKGIQDDEELSIDEELENIADQLSEEIESYSR